MHISSDTDYTDLIMPSCLQSGGLSATKRTSDRAKSSLLYQHASCAQLQPAATWGNCQLRFASRLQPLLITNGMFSTDHLIHLRDYKCTQHVSFFNKQFPNNLPMLPFSPRSSYRNRLTSEKKGAGTARMADEYLTLARSQRNNNKRMRR